eukprot:190091_1
MLYFVMLHKLPKTKKCAFTIILFINISILCSFFLYLKTMNMLEFNEDNASFQIKIPSNYLRDMYPLPQIQLSSLPNVTCLIWPRIPKTGGENLLTTLRYLIPNEKRIITDAGSAYNEDKHYYSFSPHEKYDLDWITYEELIEYYEYVINHQWNKRKAWDSPKPNANLFILQYHGPFMSIDLSEPLTLKRTQWKYISMIRNPINRIVSSFYYLRGESGGWRASNTSKYNKYYIPKILEMQNNYSIDECVINYNNGDNICEFSTNYYVKWFCGGNVELCNPLKINETSYELAIENIDKYFAKPIHVCCKDLSWMVSATYPTMSFQLKCEQLINDMNWDTNLSYKLIAQQLRDQGKYINDLKLRNYLQPQWGQELIEKNKLYYKQLNKWIYNDEKKEVNKDIINDINSVLNNTPVIFVDGSYGYLPINRVALNANCDAAPYLITLDEELLKEFPYLFNDCLQIKSQFDIIDYVTILKELYANHQNKTLNENDLNKVIVILQYLGETMVNESSNESSPIKNTDTDNDNDNDNDEEKKDEIIEDIIDSTPIYMKY